MSRLTYIFLAIGAVVVLAFILFGRKMVAAQGTDNNDNTGNTGGSQTGCHPDKYAGESTAAWIIRRNGEGWCTPPIKAHL